MNSIKIGIIIGVIVVIFSTIIILNVYQEEIIQGNSEVKRTSQQTIEDNHFELMRAGWMNSGPFYIDMEQYLIGDKIFLNTSNLGEEDKGQIMVYRPYNATDSKLYLQIPFDGSESQSWNYYFTSSQMSQKNICSVNDLLGEWTVIFSGTEYSNLYFKIINQTNAWDPKKYEPVC